MAVMLLPHGAKALTISPPTTDFQLNPGDTGLGVIKLHNEQKAPITVYPIIENFEADNKEGGTPRFYPANEDHNGEALAEWIQMDTKSVTLQPDQRMSIPYSINVPANDAQPGGHYGAIVFSTQPPKQNGGSVGVTQQIGSLILVNVSGDVKEVGGIAEFGFQNPEVWYNYLPVDFFMRFENSGNTHLRPTGNLFIKNWLGQQVASIPVNSDFSSVLPLSIRRYEFGWANVQNDENWSGLEKEWKNFAFGKYTATLVISYGSSNHLVTEQRVFYVWPWRILTITGIGFAVLIALLVFLKHVYDQGVIKKYEKTAKEKAEKSEQ